MSFLNLWAFWLAAAVVPALLILYFLKLRRREERVSSTLLWKRAVQDLQVNAPFQRLRKNLLLLLQLLVLAACILALARPVVETSAASAERLVILIDRSASMNTREEDRTRLDLAKEQAIRLVKTLNRRSGSWWSFLRLGGARTQTQAMVIGFADRASVLAPFTSNVTELVEILRGITPTDGRTNIREALELAEAYMTPPAMTTDQTPVSTESPAKVVLYSDGGLADLDQAVLRSGEIELVTVGQARNNVGITALRARRNYERPEILHVFLQVENFSDEPAATTVSLDVDGAVAAAGVRDIRLGPARPANAAEPASPPSGESSDSGSTQSLSFELALERSAVVRAKITGNDALASDDEAAVAVGPPRRMRVLVVTERNFFLDSVLAGLPLKEYVFVTPQAFESAPAERWEREGRALFDVVIFDKVRPERNLPAGNYWFLGALPPGAGGEAAGTREEVQALVWWDETHPILRHVNLDFVYLAKCLDAKPPKEAETLIEGPHGPVLFRFGDGPRQYLVQTFAIEESTWWQKPSFPVFAYNAIRFLGGAGEAERSAAHPGDTLRISLPEGAGQAEIVTPTGERFPLTPDETGTAFFGGTERVGVYRVHYQVGGDRRTDYYAVNLEDAWESDIRPREAAELGRPEIKAGQAIETATPEVWRWFVGAALLIALLEWYVYSRRVRI